MFLVTRVPVLALGAARHRRAGRIARESTMLNALTPVPPVGGFLLSAGRRPAQSVLSSTKMLEGVLWL
jgi:hypothetical protein